MRRIDLSSIFERLIDSADFSKGADVFDGMRLERGENHAAIDASRCPMLLIDASTSRPRPATLSLENLSVEHGVRCVVRQADGGESTGDYTVLRCLAEDRVLQMCFLDLGEALLASLQDQPTQRQVADGVDRLAQLFRAIERPSVRSIQGLWGELFILCCSHDPASLVEAWHNDACERHDYACGDERLEVKTSATPHRRHHFSLEQLAVPEGVKCFVASLQVERTTGGDTLASMWDKAREAVAMSPLLRAKIDRVVMESLGAGWQNAIDAEFDSTVASESLAFYQAEDVPCIDRELPVGVEAVRFLSDLSGVAIVSPEAVEHSELLRKTRPST